MVVVFERGRGGRRYYGDRRHAMLVPIAGVDVYVVYFKRPLPKPHAGVVHPVTHSG